MAVVGGRSSCGCTHAGCSHSSGGRSSIGTYGRINSKAIYSNSKSNYHYYYRGNVAEKNPFGAKAYIARPENKLLKDLWKLLPFSIMGVFMLLGMLFLGVGDQIVGVFMGTQPIKFVVIRNIVIVLALGFGSFWLPFVSLRDYFRTIKNNKSIIEQGTSKKVYDKNSGAYV